MCKPDNGNSLLKKIKRVTIGEGLLRYCVRGWRGLRGAAGWGGAVRGGVVVVGNYILLWATIPPRGNIISGSSCYMGWTCKIDTVFCYCYLPFMCHK